MNAVAVPAQSQATQNEQLISAHEPNFAMHAASQLGFDLHASAAKPAMNGWPAHAALTRASAVEQSGCVSHFRHPSTSLAPKPPIPQVAAGQVFG